MNGDLRAAAVCTCASLLACPRGWSLSTALLSAPHKAPLPVPPATPAPHPHPPASRIFCTRSFVMSDSRCLMASSSLGSVTST